MIATLGGHIGDWRVICLELSQPEAILRSIPY
jgi:hypothetical protein